MPSPTDGHQHHPPDLPLGSCASSPGEAAAGAESRETEAAAPPTAVANGRPRAHARSRAAGEEAGRVMAATFHKEMMRPRSGRWWRGRQESEPRRGVTEEPSLAGAAGGAGRGFGESSFQEVTGLGVSPC